MVPEKEIQSMRAMLENAENPLFFFDDDADGLSSFLTLNDWLKKGNWVVVKSRPQVSDQYLGRIDEFQPDLVVILDLAIVTEDFIENCKVPILWIDHHVTERKDYKHLTQFNPRKWDKEDNRSTSYWTYRIAEQGLLRAMIGIVGDWTLPDDVTKEFKKQYPHLLPKDVTKPEDALFKTKLGTLIRMVNFSMKGILSESKKAIKWLIKIQDVEELLQPESKEAQAVVEKYEGYLAEYNKLLKKAPKSDNGLIYFHYKDENNSFTSELSNELVAHNPDDFVMVCREVEEGVTCSLRGPEDVLGKLQKALEGVDGYGGGHVLACGCHIKKDDFKLFFTSYKAQIGPK